MTQEQFRERHQLALVTTMMAFEQLNDVLECSDPKTILGIVRSMSLVERAMYLLQELTNEQQIEDRTNENILASTYHTNARGTICVVACKVNTHEPDFLIVWRAYISRVNGINEQDDASYTKDWGSPLDEQVARAYFPLLAKFKYKDDSPGSDSASIASIIESEKTDEK